MDTTNNEKTNDPPTNNTTTNPNPNSKRNHSLSPPSDADTDGFVTPKYNRRKQQKIDLNDSTSSTDSTASTSSTPKPKPTLFTAYILNIPSPHFTQKHLYSCLKQLPNLIIHSLRLTTNNRAIVQSTDEKLTTKLSPLKNILNCTSLIISPRNPIPPRIPAASSSAPNPSFSVVVRGVDLDVTSEDVEQALAESNVEFTRAWRIKARATNQETRLFRITTKSPKSVDHLLSSGLLMFGKKYQIEPSNLPGPQPLQCGKCFAFGHTTTTCKSQKPTCLRCGEKHATTLPCTAPAPSKVPKCTNCAGPHFPFSQKCPQRPQPSSPSKIAPIKCVDRPAEDISDSETDEDEVERFTRVEDTIRFTYLCLINLLPQHRDIITQVIAQSSAQFFKRKVAVTATGNKLHVGVSHLKKPTKTPWVIAH